MHRRIDVSPKIDDNVKLEYDGPFGGAKGKEGSDETI
jgi:hypothetical protein